VCVPSDYTGFYIKCNLLRKIKKLATNLPAVTGSRPLRHYSIVRPKQSIWPYRTLFCNGQQSIWRHLHFNKRPNNLPGHTPISINGRTIYLATPLHQYMANNLPDHNTMSCRLTQIIYTTHTWYRRQTHVRTLSNPATTPVHSRSRRQWRDPVGSPKVNDDLYYFPKYIFGK